MAEASIRVVAYAGYRGEENPRVFFLEDARIEVMKILDQWLDEHQTSKHQKRYFRIKGSDSRVHLLCHDERGSGWFYCQ